MKILYVLEHYHPYIGGAEKLFQDVAERMSAQGHDITVVTTKFHQNLPSEEFHNGVKVLRVNSINRYLFTVFSLFKLFRLREDFDLVHSTTYNAALPAWVFAKCRKIPSILTFHEVWGKLWFEFPFLSFFEKWGFYLYEQAIAALRFDRYIAVSQSTQKALASNGIPVQHIETIYNGLDYDQFKPCSKPQSGLGYRFLYFGRLGVSKGLNLLIPAFKRLTDKYSDTHLDLVLPEKPKGMLKKVKELIANTKNDKIILHHDLPRAELHSLICHSNAVVIPSYSEGFCYVAAETSALGVPIIHSGRGALSEVVSGKNIKHPHQTSLSIFEAMEKAYNSQWEEDQSKKFELSATIDSYINLYQSMKKK